MFRVCLDPLQRSFGGKNPLRRVSKHERKLMQQVKQLRKRCSPGREQFYLDTIKDLQGRLNGAREFYSGKIKALEINLAECRHSINTLRNNRARLLRRGTVALRAANLAHYAQETASAVPAPPPPPPPPRAPAVATSKEEWSDASDCVVLEVQQPDAGILIGN